MGFLGLTPTQAPPVAGVGSVSLVETLSALSIFVVVFLVFVFALWLAHRAQSRRGTHDRAAQQQQRDLAVVLAAELPVEARELYEHAPLSTFAVFVLIVAALLSVTAVSVAGALMLATWVG